MGAVTSIGLTPEFFLRAFEAGNDLLLFSQTTPLVEKLSKPFSPPRAEALCFGVESMNPSSASSPLKARIEFVPLRYRAHLKPRITRQIEKLRRAVIEAGPASCDGIIGRMPERERNTRSTRERMNANALLCLLCFLCSVLLTGCGNQASADPEVITIALDQPPTNLDPRIGVDASSERFFQIMFSSLVKKDEHSAIQPDLAIDLGYSRSQDLHLSPAS